MNTTFSRTAQTIVTAAMLTALVSGMGEAARIAPNALAVSMARELPSASPSERNATNVARASAGSIVNIP